MTRKRKKRGITPWKKTALKACVLLLIAAAWIHVFREWKSWSFDDQREAARWGSTESCAQVSAFLPTEGALREENIQELEYKINTALAQDSIKLTAEGKDAKLWQDCYSGNGELTLAVGSKTVKVEAVGTGGAFFTFHPLDLTSGTYYLPDSMMKDEILLDEETAWKLFGSFDVEGRTVRVQDMHLRISGVYKKKEGSLYTEGGLSEYVVFVQYKTLLQYGGSGGGSGSGTQYDGQIVPGSASSPSGSAFLLASEGPAEADEIGDLSEEEAPAEEELSTTEEETVSQGSETGGQTGNSIPESSQGTQSDAGNGQGSDTDSEQNMENVGTGNTRYEDTGMITTYEIVMPNPVEGYAAAAVMKALGEESGAIVVDNTNRYEIPNLVRDLRSFALLGMRTRAVRYPYWENVAIGWEMIFAALFLLECILIAVTILLLIWMLIHWYTHRTWTLLSGVQNLQDSVYEKQSKKRYPEYYKEKEEDLSEREAPSAKEPAGPSENKKTADAEKEKSRLEDKGLTPFEKIPENRKAVQYETKHQDDQRDDGSSARSDHGGVR